MSADGTRAVPANPRPSAGTAREPEPAPRTERAENTQRYDPSLNSFFNAVVKETDVARFAPDPEPAFRIDVAGGELAVPCEHRSLTGRHRLVGPCRLRGSDGERPVTFPEAARRTLERLADADDAERCLRRVLRSRRNLRAAVRDRREDLDRLFSGELSFVEAEQALIAGHSLHPCPKDRGATSPRQARAWAACHGPRFGLVWTAIAREHLATFTAGEADHASIVADLAEGDDALARERARLDDEAALLPCHPYQLDRWRAHPRLATLFAEGSIEVLGRGTRDWAPTTSVRTLWADEAAWMPKFSLSVKLTNSRRHLHVEELARGPRFTRLWTSAENRGLRERFPELQVLEEPVSALVRDAAGEPVEAAGLAWRANPFTGDRAQDTEVLATLLQDDPRDGEPRLAQRLREAGAGDREGAIRWFERFLDVAVRPFLLAHADHGLIFSAHQQNLVLGLDGVWPETVSFRDCQGVGFSPLGQERYGDLLAGWADDVALAFDRETSATLLGYYLVVNSVFNAVASLAIGELAPETVLLERFAAFLEELRDRGLRDPTLVTSLLADEQLGLKGNLHYALLAVDETTQDRDVLDLYRPVANPLAEGSR